MIKQTNNQYTKPIFRVYQRCIYTALLCLLNEQQKQGVLNEIKPLSLAQTRVIEDFIEWLGEIMQPGPVFPIEPHIIFTNANPSNNAVAREVGKNGFLSAQTKIINNLTK